MRGEEAVSEVATYGEDAWANLMAQSDPGQTAFEHLAQVAHSLRHDAAAPEETLDLIRGAQATIGTDPELGSLPILPWGEHAGDNVAAYYEGCGGILPPDEGDVETLVPEDDDTARGIMIRGGGRVTQAKCCHLMTLKVKFAPQAGGNPTSKPIPVGPGVTISRGTFVGRLEITVFAAWDPHSEWLDCELLWSEQTTVAYPGVPADGNWHVMPGHTDLARHFAQSQRNARRTGFPSRPTIDRPGYKPTRSKPSRVLKGMVTVRSGCPDGPSITFSWEHRVGAGSDGSVAQQGFINGTKRF